FRYVETQEITRVIIRTEEEEKLNHKARPSVKKESSEAANNFAPLQYGKSSAALHQDQKQLLSSTVMEMRRCSSWCYRASQESILWSITRQEKYLNSQFEVRGCRAIRWSMGSLPATDSLKKTVPHSHQVLIASYTSRDEPVSLEGNTSHVIQTSPLIGMLAHAKPCDCIQLLAGKESISRGNNISFPFEKTRILSQNGPNIIAVSCSPSEH
ncbi:hypothetical protein STEG23_037370, partial [Scotinomys teguina]